MLPAHRANPKLNRSIENMSKPLNKHCQIYVYLSNHKYDTECRIHITKTSKNKCRNDTIVNSSNMAERVIFFKITPSDHFLSYRVKFKSIPEIWV